MFGYGYDIMLWLCLRTYKDNIPPIWFPRPFRMVLYLSIILVQINEYVAIPINTGLETINMFNFKSLNQILVLTYISLTKFCKDIKNDYTMQFGL